MWGTLDEQQIIIAAQRGQSEAYGELVRRYQVLVFNTAYRLCGDRHEAQDLAQEAFVRAYAALHGFESGRPFRPWIARIVTNLALNWRSRQRPAVSLASHGSAEDLAWEPTDATPGPEELALRGEREARLRAAILALPPLYRVVIELRHFQEFSYEQIAATLSLPLSDVKSYLFRARRMLQSQLEEA